jgi:hypothetical protein
MKSRLPEEHEAREDLDPEKLVERVLAARARVAPLLPDIDPGDLVLILESLLRPAGSGKRFFLRECAPGLYVP